MKWETVLPGEIEKKSFEIIGEELKSRYIILPEDERLITMRVIHTTADFDYAETMTYSDGAVEELRELIRGGADIVTDTNMALTGINKSALAKFGGEVHCFMADPGITQRAAEQGCTRAAASMEYASEKMQGPVIFAVGNAPTALMKLYEIYEEGIYRPAFVIGVPVGFVNVEAAKDLILSTDLPSIVNRGRKGGSGVAAAIVNAVLYQLDRP